MNTKVKLPVRKMIQANGSKGFTLLEVILAISLAGFVLAAATAFLVSVSNIWLDREERNFFEDHVDGVVEFLNASFASAGMEIALEGSSEDPLNDTQEGSSENTENEITAPERGGLVRISEEPVGWGKPPGSAQYEDPLLNFTLTQTPPLFVNINKAPVIGVSAFLHVDDDEGLSLLWYSLLQEEAEKIDDLRRTEISPLVKEIKYIYWDERFEKWEEEEDPKEGESDDVYELPRYIKLYFEYKGETKERTLAIPVPSISALLF